MKPYEIRGVQQDDLLDVSKYLRGADIREIVAATGSTNVDASIRMTVEHSTQVCAAFADDTLLALFGYVKRSPKSLVIWAVATPYMRKYSRDFIRNSRPTIQKWFRENPEVQYMWNFTYAENTLHHRWLNWCGAELLPPVKSGPRGELFIPFVIKRENYDV